MSQRGKRRQAAIRRLNQIVDGVEQIGRKNDQMTFEDIRISFAGMQIAATMALTEAVLALSEPEEAT